MEAIRRADCPNCGGPIEFKLGSSLACVCPFCRFSVVRTDRDLEALGKVADLVPTAPIMTVGDTGTLLGGDFRVGGRTQLDHGRGPWDEWYVEFEPGRWGWLAKAQGRFYVTYPTAVGQPPSFESLNVGDAITLDAGGDTRFTVVEKGRSRLVSAEGELPFPAKPDSVGRYADLEGPDGEFATLDYGDGSEPAQLFLGHGVEPSQVTLQRQAVGPRPEQVVDASRLRCPTCGAPVPIRVPETTERAACQNCNSLLNFEAGALQFLSKMDQPEVEPDIPLGSEGVLAGEQVLVVGFLERFVTFEGVKYPWHEYLLHTKNGYRWLTRDQGHYTYLRPVSAGQVEVVGATARFRKKRFKAFQSGTATVGVVLGEFYWLVQRGDRAQTMDYIAPPYSLSQERTGSEVNWSHGEYIKPSKVWQAFKLEGKPTKPLGVAPAQPNPTRLGQISMIAFALIAGLFVAMGITGSAKKEDARLSVDIAVPSAPSAGPGTITQTDTFEIKNGPNTIELDITTTVSNSWLGLGTALVNEDTGEVRQFYVLVEEWHGYSGGESWSEGSNSTTEHIEQVPKGRYSLRFQPEWGRGTVASAAPSAKVSVRPGERGTFCCMCSGLLLLLPLVFGFIRKGSFEARRWRDSNVMHGGGS